MHPRDMQSSKEVPSESSSGDGAATMAQQQLPKIITPPSHSVRGIRNVTGVSCHISAALQLMHHGMPDLRNALIDLADALSDSTEADTDTKTPSLQAHKESPPQIRFLYEMGLLFKELLHPPAVIPDSTCLSVRDAIDPMPLYEVLPSSLNYHNVGDAATALRAILAAIRNGIEEIRKLEAAGEDTVVIAEVERTLFEDCFCGSIIQRVEGTKRIVTLDASGNRVVKLMKRSKPDRERPLSVPFPVPVRGYGSLESALGSVTIEAQTITGYDWEAVTNFSETASAVGPYKPTNGSAQDDHSSSSSSSSADESDDESSSVSTSTSSDTSSSSSLSSCSENFNVWRTSKCTLLKKLPPYLFFHLKRFEYRNAKVQKISSVLDIPEELCIDPFRVDGPEAAESGTFVLHGAIVHIDERVESSDSTIFDDAGHYISYVRLREEIGGEGHDIATQLEACRIDTYRQQQWIEINDETAKIVSVQDVQTGTSACATAAKYVRDILSGRYSKTNAAGTSAKYATLLLYKRQKQG